MVITIVRARVMHIPGVTDPKKNVGRKVVRTVESIMIKPKFKFKIPTESTGVI